MNTSSSLDRETFQQLLASAFAVQESQINPQSLSDIMDVQRSVARGKLDVDGTMRHLVESARNVANAAGVAIALLNGDQLTYRAGSGTSASCIGQHVMALLTVSADAKTSREILRVENAQTDARIEADICRQFGANALGDGDGRFDLFRFTALLARCPVQAAQAVQNGSTDFVLGVGFQLDVVDGIEMVDRRNQPEHTGGNQIVDADAIRQARLDIATDQPYP